MQERATLAASKQFDSTDADFLLLGWSLGSRGLTYNC
jgi:hypothetical protein